MAEPQQYQVVQQVVESQQVPLVPEVQTIMPIGDIEQQQVIGQVQQQIVLGDGQQQQQQVVSQEGNGIQQIQGQGQAVPEGGDPAAVTDQAVALELGGSASVFRK